MVARQTSFTPMDRPEHLSDPSVPFSRDNLFFIDYDNFKTLTQFIGSMFHLWEVLMMLICNVTNKNTIKLDLNILLGPHKFHLQATIDRHGLSMFCGYHTMLY